MTLRLRIFLLVAGLVLAVVAGQALLVRSLAGRIDHDVRTVATSVGRDILSGFFFETRVEATNHEASGERVLTFVTKEQSPDSPLAAPESAASEDGTARWVIRQETRTRDPSGEHVERRIETELRPGPGTESFSLEPDPGSDVLFLRGPLPERRIAIPVSPVASTLGQFQRRALVGSLALLLAGLVAAGVLAHRTTRPLAELAAATRRVGAGELGAVVADGATRPDGRRDEIGEVVAGFNAMSLRLAELDRDNRRLAESEHLSELAEVARGLAHTLRNPLNALGLAVERLAGERDAHRAEELAESCRRQIRRVDGSLRGFLALATAAAARAEPTEVGSLARDVALEAIQDAGGRVRIDVEAAGQLELPAVPAELKAMLQALVVNACEASPTGGRVVVRVEPVDDGARITIDDEGGGVAAEVAARLFAPHVTTKPHGSGMGLYLARRLAQSRYGGEVELVPRSGGGTRASLVVGPRRAESA